MLWVLKESSQRDGSFEHPKHMLKLMDKKFNFMLEFLVYLNLWVQINKISDCTIVNIFL